MIEKSKFNIEILSKWFDIGIERGYKWMVLVYSEVHYKNQEGSYDAYFISSNEECKEFCNRLKNIENLHVISTYNLLEDKFRQINNLPYLFEECKEYLNIKVSSEARYYYEQGDAITIEGAIYHNPEAMRFKAEEYEACMIAMNKANVPVKDENGNELSIWGRAFWMMENKI